MHVMYRPFDRMFDSSCCNCDKGTLNLIYVWSYAVLVAGEKENSAYI